MCQVMFASCTAHPATAQLACHLVKEAFGELCETVLRCLLYRGPATFAELRSALSDISFYQIHRGIRDSNLKNATPLGPADARRALLVLLQHACVFVRLPAGANSRPEQAVYRVDVQAVLHRLRYSRCMQHIRQLFECPIKESIMEQLLDNGQLKFEQVRDAVATASGMASEVCKEEEILQGIGQLVDAHFIERAPPCNLPDEKVAVHPNAQPKRGRAAPKPNTPEEARLNEERARAITNKRYRDDRYSLSTQQLHGSGTDGAADEKPKPPYPETNGNPAGRGSSAGAKRKRNTGEEAAELMASSVVPSGLWRISQNEFTRQFRYAACATFAAERHGDDAGLVVKGLLAAGRPAWTENAASEATSPPATQTSIAAAVRDLPGGKHLDVAAVRQILQELRSGMAGCVLTTPEGSFYLHLARTVELMQEAEVHAHLLSRFGHEGLRIWNMLRLRGQLEESAIAESALMAPKEARTMLYQLLSSGFVSLQDIPKGSDRAASRMFWTWRAHLPAAAGLLRAHVVKGILNLMLRMEHEAQQHFHVTNLFLEGANLTTSQLEALQRLKDIQTVCGSRQLRMQSLLSLFNEY